MWVKLYFSYLCDKFELFVGIKVYNALTTNLIYLPCQY